MVCTFLWPPLASPCNIICVILKLLPGSPCSCYLSLLLHFFFPLLEFVFPIFLLYPRHFFLSFLVSWASSSQVSSSLILSLHYNMYLSSYSDPLFGTFMFSKCWWMLVNDLMDILVFILIVFYNFSSYSSFEWPPVFLNMFMYYNS